MVVNFRFAAMLSSVICERRYISSGKDVILLWDKFNISRFLQQKTQVGTLWKTLPT